MLAVIQLYASEMTKTLQAIKLDKYDWKKKKSLNKQTLHYFLKLSVAAELKRTELELFCTIVFS